MTAKACLITGSTRGIGKAIADELTKRGYDVIGLARTRPEWWNGRFIECDILDASALSAACEEIGRTAGLWALVNNAGVGHADSLSEIKLSDMQRVFMANTFAPALIAQSASALMVRSGEGGRIVNICSTVALGKAERNSYGSSKAALASLTRTWALELAAYDITVNAVSPGPIETELFRSRNPVGSPQERRQLSGVPAGRFGEPAQVASLVAYLVDADASYCTGQVIYLDGGSSIGKSLS